MSNSFFTNVYINHRNTCKLLFTILHLIDKILQFLISEFEINKIRPGQFKIQDRES